MGIFIIEGVDCTGKTTLAKELAKRTGYEIVKGSSFEIAKNGANYMFEYMSRLLDRENIIIDRFFHSNWVYSDVYNYDKMTIEQFSALANKVNHRALLVYLYANPDTIIKRMRERGENYVDEKDVEILLQKYQEIFQHSVLGNKMVIQINTDFAKHPVIISAMLDEMMKLQETQMTIKM